MKHAVLVLAIVVAGCATETTDENIASDVAPLVDVAAAQELLYPDAAPPATCMTRTGAARVTCLISQRYASDPTARDTALDFFRTTGGVAGVLRAETYNGGYRGSIRLVPALPAGTRRRHLVWATDALADIDVFLRALQKPMRYRWRGLNLAFFESISRTTPSAFTTDRAWTLHYNVVGSLNSSEAAVRETIFHELFHLNDWGQQDWSARVLAPIVAGIIARCGTDRACLAPYTPTDVVVTGGTYYAFQPGPPTALEYAAELAVRYQAEEQARIDGRTFAKPPFKCGPPENARAWQLIVDTFFGGADLVPSCPR